MGDEAFRPLVVMPAYNEEEALGGVLAEVFDRLPGWGVVVVADGSVDRTAQVAKEAGAVALNLPFNLTDTTSGRKASSPTIGFPSMRLHRSLSSAARASGVSL